MAFNNRRMLLPYQPEESYTFTFFIPDLLIYPPPPPPPPPPPQQDLSVLFSTLICIIGSVMLFLFLTVFLYLYIMRSRRSSPAAVAPVSTNRREDENEETGERDFSGDHHVWRITTAGLHHSVINSITVVGFKKGEGIIDGTDCSVCLSEFEEDEELRVLPKCRHAFHINCIDTWLRSHENCPLCRAPVLPTEPRKIQTETDHQSESGSSNEEEESSGSRNAYVLPRSRSDLASHCGGSGRLETVRRSFSIGGRSSLVKAEGSDDVVVASRSRRQFYSSFSANFFSSSRRTRNQESVLPSRMPSMSG